jgi:hypothetical protein
LSAGVVARLFAFELYTLARLQSRAAGDENIGLVFAIVHQTPRIVAALYAAAKRTSVMHGEVENSCSRACRPDANGHGFAGPVAWGRAAAAAVLRKSRSSEKQTEQDARC